MKKIDTSPRYTDADIVARLNRGDKEAFREIFDRYNTLLYSHVLNKLGDESEACDIVQEVFIALWERKGTIKDENIAGYLFTIARNKVLNVIKHKKVIHRYEEHFRHFADLHASNNTEDILYKKELEAIINAEIATLPPRMREAFELSRKGYLTHQEIADYLGISKQTVDGYIRDSLKTLRMKIAFLILFILISAT